VSPAAGPAAHCVLALKIVPRAARAGVAGRLGDRWKIRLRAPPVDGRANDELLAVLAEKLDCPTSAVRLVGGAGHSLKRVRVEGLAPAEAERRMARAAAQ